MTRQLFISIVFLTLTVIFISCNEKVKSDSLKDTIHSLKKITTGQPKKSLGLLQSKNGNFWFSSGNNEGVTVYNGKSFTNYTEKDGLSSNFVWTILEDNAGNLWFGTADGITRYDGNTFTVIPITDITGNASYRKTLPDSYGFPVPSENWVMSIMQDKTGTLWFGTISGIYRYDGKTFKHFSHNDNVPNTTGVAIGSIESILQDSNGNIWFGGRGTPGVFRYDGKVLTNFKPDGEDWVYPLLQDKAGNIWFSKRTRGVLSYDGKNFNRIGDNVFSDFFFHMEEDNAGNFWFGSIFYDGKSFVNYTEQDGLCNEFMRRVLKDKDGHIWFSCKNGGLCRYDGKAFSTFSE